VQKRTRRARVPSTHTESEIPNRISLQKRAEPVVLGASDTLKLTFQVTEQSTENGVQPHQTFLRFFDSTTGEEGIQPVKVTPSGKAKFELVRFFDSKFPLAS
jgi:oligosaccharyltransferase complex subunit delta (ribophorin II)